MENDRLNNEGYSDPTPHKAMRNISKEEKKTSSLGFRPVVYICSPFRGDIEKNTENARRYCGFAITRGAIPFAPHLLYPQFMDDDKAEDRKLALFMGQVMLDKCAELWVFGTVISEGMRSEIDRAQLKEKKIRYFKQEECL